MTAIHDELETGRITDAAGFTSIVVALDLEANGDRALPVARGLAELGGIPVELLTVSSPHIAEDVDVFELRRRAAENGWPDNCYTIAHDNHPAQAIVDLVQRRDGALLVMATSAQPPLAGHLLGNVIEEVLEAIDQPVLLVGPNVPSFLRRAATYARRLRRRHRRRCRVRAGDRPLGRHLRRRRDMGHRSDPDRQRSHQEGQQRFRACP